MIGRAKGHERELNDLLGRRARAEAEAQEAAAELERVQAEIDDRLRVLALSDASADA